MTFGGAFGPPPPPSPEVRQAEATDAMRALCVQLEALIRSLGGTPSTTTTPTTKPELTDMVNAVVGIKGPATAEEIAAALHARLNPNAPDVSEAPAVVFAKLARTLENLDFRLKGAGAAFGSSVTAPANTATEDTLQQLRDRVATDSTLGVVRDVLIAVRDHVDTLEALSTDLRTELRRRPVHRVASADASVPQGTVYTTVAAVTPAVAVTVTGFNADFTALVTGALRYRARLVTGTDASPTILAAEELSTEVGSWVPVAVDIAAGTRIAVQVIHGEVTAQEFRATLAYYEEP